MFQSFQSTHDPCVESHDVGDRRLFLSSNDARFVTGEQIGSKAEAKLNSPAGRYPR